MNFYDFNNKLKTVAQVVDSPVDYSHNSRICFEKANDYWISDSYGKKYIDFNNGKGSITLGHNFSAINNAIIDFLSSGKNIITGPNGLLLELSNKLIEAVTDSNDYKIAFFSTGTEACKSTAYAFRKYNNKKFILSSGYHGWDLMWETSEHFLKPNCSNVLDFYFIPSLLEDLLYKYRKDVSYVIISPDYIHLKKSTLMEIIDICNNYDIPICIDDVKQGFRYGPSSSIKEYTNQSMDMYVFSKGLSNGHRISCVVGKEEYMENFEDYTYTTYYDSIPFIASYETLNYMIMNDCYKVTRSICEHIVLCINNLFLEFGLPIKALSFGSMFQFVFYNQAMKQAFYQKSLEEGLVFYYDDNQSISYVFKNVPLEWITEKIEKVCTFLVKNFKNTLHCEIPTIEIFKSAFNMIDGAADCILDECRRIELTKEILKIINE